MNGTDDWTGPAKPTEKMDPMPEYSTFGMTKMVDGKTVITCDTVPGGLGLGTESKGSVAVDLSVPGVSGFDAVK